MSTKQVVVLAGAFCAGAFAMWLLSRPEERSRPVAAARRDEDEEARAFQALGLCDLDGDSHTTDVLLDRLEIPKTVEGIPPPPIVLP